MNETTKKVISRLKGIDVDYIKEQNKKFPGYSCCARCKGNWGWKEHASHMTSPNQGIFLFCQECDGVVTLKERWQALDEWKVEAIRQISVRSPGSLRAPERKEVNDGNTRNYPTG